MQPPVVPGDAQMRPPLPQAADEAAPQRPKMNPWSIALAAFGALMLLASWAISLGSAISTNYSTGAVPEASTVTVYETQPVFAPAPTTAGLATGTATSAPTMTAQPPTSAQPTTPTPSAEPQIREGKWTVGDDIPPGRYRTNSEVAAACAWQITKTGSNGSNADDVIAKDTPGGGRPAVTLKVGWDFKTNGCGTWSKTK